MAFDREAFARLAQEIEKQMAHNSSNFVIDETSGSFAPYLFPGPKFNSLSVELIWRTKNNRPLQLKAGKK